MENNKNNIIRRNTESALTGRPKTCYKQHRGKEYFIYVLNKKSERPKY